MLALAMPLMIVLCGRPLHTVAHGTPSHGSSHHSHAPPPPRCPAGPVSTCSHPDKRGIDGGGRRPDATKFSQTLVDLANTNGTAYAALFVEDGVVDFPGEPVVPTAPFVGRAAIAAAADGIRLSETYEPGGVTSEVQQAYYAASDGQTLTAVVRTRAPAAV